MYSSRYLVMSEFSCDFSWRFLLLRQGEELHSLQPPGVRETPATAAFRCRERAMPGIAAATYVARCGRAFGGVGSACRDGKKPNAQIVVMRRFVRRHSEQTMGVDPILERDSTMML